MEELKQFIEFLKIVLEFFKLIKDNKKWRLWQVFKIKNHFLKTV